MIYHNSKDPVLVKKIDLKIWFLRDELETVIEEKIKKGQEVDSGELAKTYAEKLEAVDQSNMSEEEAEMAAAISEGDDSAEEGGDEVSIGQYHPPLAKEKIYNGQTILTEIHMDRVYFFSNREFLEGQSIVLEFLIPKNFILNADIQYCRLYNHKSRIISSNPLPYRCCAEFSFLKEGERTILRQFLASIEPEVPEEVPVQEAPSGGDDGFDELDDFDI